MRRGRNEEGWRGSKEQGVGEKLEEGARRRSEERERGEMKEGEGGRRGWRKEEQQLPVSIMLVRGRRGGRMWGNTQN